MQLPAAAFTSQSHFPFDFLLFQWLSNPSNPHFPWLHPKSWLWMGQTGSQSLSKSCCELVLSDAVHGELHSWEHPRGKQEIPWESADKFTWQNTDLVKSGNPLRRLQTEASESTFWNFNLSKADIVLKVCLCFAQNRQGFSGCSFQINAFLSATAMLVFWGLIQLAARNES